MVLNLKNNWKNYIGYGIPILISFFFSISVLSDTKYSCGLFGCDAWDFFAFMFFIPSFLILFVYVRFIVKKIEMNKFILYLIVLTIIFYVLPLVFYHYYHLLNPNLPSPDNLF